jgi:phosphoribosylformimino-5-aminoimidazole carboxamide ribotide isomerase
LILYPAIDILGGNAVRLVEGDYERGTVYDADPVDAALRWAEEGSHYLHVVDLDGARSGEPANLEVVRRIADSVPFPIQVGGGLRDEENVANVLRAGAERVVIGTAALRDPRFLQQMLDRHGERVAVSVDARGGNVSLAGWTETSRVPATEAVAELSLRGVSRFIFTPIEVDGTLAGPGLRELATVAGSTTASIIYSGGIGSLEDLELLCEQAAPNVEGVIVGRALYESRFNVADAIAALA